MTKNWSAIIPAGGTGSRLRPLTSFTPKPLVKVGNVPLIDFAISHLIYADIKDIIITAAYKGEQIKNYLEKNWTPEKLHGANLETYIIDSKGNAEAYRMMADHIDSENVVVSMSDIITNLPMKSFMKFHEEKDGIATISMKTVESHTSQYGVVLLDKNRKIYLFLEKPAPMELYLSSMAQRTDLFLHTNIINTGIYAFKNNIGTILEETELIDFGGQVFPYLLENEFDLYGFVKDYYWLDCGNPQTYKWANWDLLRKYGWPITPAGEEYDGIYVMGIINSGDGVVINKPTCFGEFVRLENSVRIGELSSLGNHVTIGQDAKIEKSIIWDDVLIGAGSYINDSVICNDCEIGKNVVIENSIIAPYNKIEDEREIRGKSLKVGEQAQLD